jgi:(E)-4-hydroxy-3-methyl-but-2-enyl pyrophosphate reductase
VRKRRDDEEDRRAEREGGAGKLKIVLADRIGFCFGVKRAVNIAEEAIRVKGAVYSLGSLIHNRQVVRDLSRKGLKAVKGPAEIKKGAVVMPSHGVSPSILSELAAKGLRIIDATCPFVRKAQGAARLLSNAGYTVVIVGDSGHPEVKAILGSVDGRVLVVKDGRASRLLRFRAGEKASVIAQTTQSSANFAAAVKAIAAKKPAGLKIVNTICKDAEIRQDAARRTARGVDAMIVIGGHDSANTRRLSEVCENISKRSYHVESEKELKNHWLKDACKIGVTSGASTPQWVIDKVVEKIKTKSNKKGRSRG